MIAFANLLDDWSSAMIRASWQGSLAVLAVASACWLWPSLPARFQSWLWRIALLKFLVAFAWSAPIELPLLPATPSIDRPARESIPTRAASHESMPGATSRESRPYPVLPLLFIAWVVLLGWQLLRIVSAHRKARTLLSMCQPCEDGRLPAGLAALANSAGIGSVPKLFVMPGQGSPLLVGVLRPAIVFPRATLDQLDDSERSMVLCHELAHWRRGDLAFGLFAATIRAVFCFHPLAWWCERKMRATAEIAADELAMTLQHRDPVGYATLLVSVIGKLGPTRPISAMSVGMTGSHHSLHQRLAAMRFMKPGSGSSQRAFVYGIGSACIALVGLLPWAVVASAAPAEAPAEPAAIQQAAAPGGQKDATERGRFVSFQNGTLTIQANSGESLARSIPESAKTLIWNDGEKQYQPVDTAAALKQAQAGTWLVVMVRNNEVTLRLGSRKSATTGTFVSFKSDRLLILGLNLGESYTKKYGNQVHLRKFRDDVPAYESVDGGAYESIGPANKVLGNVKEGTIITVHGEGDENITLIQIGVPKKQ